MANLDQFTAVGDPAKLRTFSCQSAAHGALDPGGKIIKMMDWYLFFVHFWINVVVYPDV